MEKSERGEEMAVIDDLLGEVPEALRRRLVTEVARLRDPSLFGIQFERHIPEYLAVPGVHLRRGTRVALRGGAMTDTFLVSDLGPLEAEILSEAGEVRTVPRTDLVAVKRFGEPVFPAIRHIASVLRGSDAPHHVLIEGENHSVLGLLNWTHKGRVDCIYIDPPYNTGATSWMYNNKIVDRDDAYRSSKWLSMMERRLALAKPLLKDDGVIIVTIDENELATLRLLMDRPTLFRGWDIHIVTIQHNPRGIQGDNFSVTNEFALFATRKGNKAIGRRRLRPGEELSQPLRKWGAESERHTAARCFYPIRFKDGRFVSAGDVLPGGQDPPGRMLTWDDGTLEFWPLDASGVQRKWRYARDTIEDVAENLEVVEVGGRLDVNLVNDTAAQKTVWTDTRYAAFTNGTALVNSIVGQKFPFPKSVYATFDCVEAVVRDRPDAVVLDFFGGSGTTAHAVAMMNEVDGGRRQCIIVTNNEVGSKEERRLRAAGKAPGDDEWEAKGICRTVTWPRLRNAIEGARPDGRALKGEWLTGLWQTNQRRPKVIAVKGLTAGGAAGMAAALGLNATDFRREGFAVGGGAALLGDPDRVEALLAALTEPDQPVTRMFYAEPPAADAARRLKALVAERMPPSKKVEEEERPLADGLRASISYFRMEYLDRDAVEVGARLDSLLPTLWLMSGGKGDVTSTAGGAGFHIPADGQWALLFRASAFRRFKAALETRVDVEWVFMVSDSQEGFLEWSALLPVGIPLTNRVRLYRQYLDNFSINWGDE